MANNIFICNQHFFVDLKLHRGATDIHGITASDYSSKLITLHAKSDKKNDAPADNWVVQPFEVSDPLASRFTYSDNRVRLFQVRHVADARQLMTKPRLLNPAGSCLLHCN